MISVICGTNRPNNYTKLFAKKYFQLLVDKQATAQFFTLEELPNSFIFDNDIFGVNNSLLEEQVSKFIEGAEKVVFVYPEYNGSFPGVLKSFIDSFHPKKIAGKKAGLIGIASGRAGNLRGLDHMTNILHYLKVNVMPNKLPISQINNLIEGAEIEEDTVSLLASHAKQMMEY